MKTKILFILTSNDSDTYYESALISIFSARYRMPNAHVILLTDNLTNKTFIGLREQILKYVSEKIVVTFDKQISKKVRSRLLKTNMRNYLAGDFIYIDCDTLIADSLEEIDECEADIAAVLDGHTSMSNHPARDLFIKQSKFFDYCIEDIENYFGGGVFFVKESLQAKFFFETWHRNYIEGLEKGMSQDEPSLSKTNFDLGNVIYELSGQWNCQMRLGGMFLKDSKIIHFWSKKNMPISYLGSKQFLMKLKIDGLNKEIKDVIINYKTTFYEPLGIVVNEDMHFNFSPLYEEVRSLFLSDKKSPFSSYLKIIEGIHKESSKTMLGNVLFIFNKVILKFEILLFNLVNRRK